MEDGEKEKERVKKAKEIAEKYRFSEIAKLGKPELLQKFKEIYYECMDLAAQVDVWGSKSLELEKQIEYYKGLWNNKPKYTEYNPDLGGIEKVIYILKANARIMLSAEIEAVLLELEPDLKKVWEDTRTNTSRYISRAVKAGMVIKYPVGNGCTYALPEWFDDDGNLIKKFLLR